MDPIPGWVRRFWDVWDLRVLALLSFTLQIILSMFGSRRKYISSLWINVLVWSGYLMADWVATVALGKLVDIQGDPEKSNILWAIWAPLLLLHLGGPDSITAYSLEDNQLWLRHLLGFVVQLSVAIYVILMSWKNSWFSFLSLPALVVGIIKYGERTWVLKSVNNENYNIPFGDVKDCYRTEGHEYVRVLVLAHCHIREVMIRLVGEGNDHGGGFIKRVSVGGRILGDTLEVSMGLMYDLIYTKATKIYTKGGFILRCISFGCTVTVSVGLIFRIVLLKTGEEDEIDMAITCVLVVGALALEIYAAIVIFSSNWGMLWLIKQGRGDWVIWLSQRFPWLFNKEKNWSEMMGQFDFVGYCLKVTKPADVQKPSRKIIRLVLGRNYEDKWNKYLHKTAYSVHTSVQKAELSYYYGAQGRFVTRDEVLEFKDMVVKEMFYHLKGKILCLHLATTICYHLEIDWDAGGDQDRSGSDSSSSLSWKQNKEVCKSLSDYMMYLLVMHPSLLPGDAYHNFGDIHLIGPDALDKKAACHFLLQETGGEAWSRAAYWLKGKEKAKRWEILKIMWWILMKSEARDSPIDGHFEQLRQGGEFLTLFWLDSSPSPWVHTIL